MRRFVISMTSYWLRNPVGENGRQALNAVSTGHLPAKDVPQQSDSKILVHFSQVCDAAKPSCFIVKCSDICCFARYEVRSLCPERSSACSGQIRWGSCVMPGALNGPKRSTTAFAAIRYFSTNCDHMSRCDLCQRRVWAQPSCVCDMLAGSTFVHSGHTIHCLLRELLSATDHTELR